MVRPAGPNPFYDRSWRGSSQASECVSDPKFVLLVTLRRPGATVSLAQGAADGPHELSGRMR